MESAESIVSDASHSDCAKESRPALFLDRDGVLIEDTGYIRDPETLVYNDALLSGLAGFEWFRAQEVLLVIISNQAGVAKGILTCSEVEAVNARLLRYMRRFGLLAAGVWYCPYHEEGLVPEYTRASELRKPKPGMLLLAAKAMNVDLARSLMVGDRESDRIQLPCLETFLLGGEYGSLAELLQIIARKFIMFEDVASKRGDNVPQTGEPQQPTE
jgi:histidinol-phosphate phosphatase family protein